MDLCNDSYEVFGLARKDIPLEGKAARSIDSKRETYRITQLLSTTDFSHSEPPPPAAIRTIRNRSRMQACHHVSLILALTNAAWQARNGEFCSEWG